jgi:hypothetical protein
MDQYEAFDSGSLGFRRNTNLIKMRLADHVKMLLPSCRPPNVDHARYRIANVPTAARGIAATALLPSFMR